MAVAQLLQEHGQLGHGLCDLHVRQVALEEDGALRPLRASVVEGVGGAGSSSIALFFLGHRGGHAERCCRAIGQSWAEAVEACGLCMLVDKLFERD